MYDLKSCFIRGLEMHLQNSWLTKMSISKNAHSRNFLNHIYTFLNLFFEVNEIGPDYIVQK